MISSWRKLFNGGESESRRLPWQNEILGLCGVNESKDGEFDCSRAMHYILRKVGIYLELEEKDGRPVMINATNGSSYGGKNGMASGFKISGC